MRFFFHFAMSRRDWIRNTRRERIVYIPVEGDGGATNLIAITKIKLGDSIIPLSDLSKGTGTEVSVNGDIGYLEIRKNADQNAWVFDLSRNYNPRTFRPTSGAYYYVGSNSFVLYGDDEDTPICSVSLIGNANVSDQYETSYSTFYLSLFQFHF